MLNGSLFLIYSYVFLKKPCLHAGKLLFVSYILFSFGLTGPILPLWFMKDAYVVALQARGKDAAYIDALFAPINTGTFIVCLVSILVCAVIGGLFGQKMIKKHFAKAGIV